MNFLKDLKEYDKDNIPVWFLFKYSVVFAMCIFSSSGGKLGNIILVAAFGQNLSIYYDQQCLQDYKASL